ncbi:DUF4369 domain-containing protein [Flavobacteriaceae bacterium]|nr:DUF4369 domain-containing protein [Flavobacteriaceae bacterium]MDA7716431.1 DUF4369 domain-containing protein [Flavobacteriaceae bacterium]MDB4024340.1 DUF4369 domain-containing protein [Flavobacteriaceae bacterium]MDB4131114.1 DUF4369 domain-containing protein [Flavobacteriaceae bacterium]MDC0593754.1 DUF4369 domain-containing protein [Flavobacteriaceae bacterium]
MKKLLLISFLFILTNCENNENNMTVKVKVENFKKGNIYLQKISDSALINVDSIFVKKNESIILKHNIDSPELFYLNLDVSDIDNRIEFFGEKGEINIDTSLEKFNSDFKISGSSIDSLYRDYLSVIKKFNNQKLDLIQLSFNLTKTELDDSLIKVQNQIKSLDKRQYLYNLNYTVSNGNSFISPLVAINEFSESGKIVLDTIKNSMSKQVLESKYGKIFSDIVKNK